MSEKERAEDFILRTGANPGNRNADYPGFILSTSVARLGEPDFFQRVREPRLGPAYPSDWFW